MVTSTLLKISKAVHHILIPKIVTKAVKTIVKKSLRILREAKIIPTLIFHRHSMKKRLSRRL